MKILRPPSCSSSSPAGLWRASVITAPSPSAGWLLALLPAIVMRAKGPEEGDSSTELFGLTSVVVWLLEEWSP